jgi:hypothetical protein
MQNGKNEEIIKELKDNSEIIIFGDEEIIGAVRAKLPGSRIISVCKDAETIKKIKNKNYNNLELIEKDINDFLNETELKEIEAVIFDRILDKIIDFPNRKIYLKVMFKILKNIVSPTGKIIIAEEKGSQKAIEHELLKKIGEKEGLKFRILNDSAQEYTVVLEKEEED